jgi:tRNA(Ile)-lysidine synthase
MTKKSARERKGQDAIAERLRIILHASFGVSAGERVGIGVSGGADSVALLRLFVELRGEMGIVPCVVHFNHELRGKASDTDEKFVAKLAAQHDLEYFVARENVAAKAKRERVNLEDAARRARYAYFELLVKEGRVARVAVAHKADDQAETVLAHILRGTGLAGLGGIHPEVGGVFRPLLGVRREELRIYLRSKRQTWREDATNRDETRTRARIRRKLLPLLQKEFQPAVVEHLCQLAELAREDNAHLEEETERRIAVVCEERADGIAIGIRELFAESGNIERRGGELQRRILGTGIVANTGLVAGGSGAQARVPVPQSIAKRMVRRLVIRVKAREGELGAGHVEAVLQFAAHGHSGQILQLPGGVEVRREREALVFRGTASKKSGAAVAEFSLEVKVPGIGETLRLDARSHILCLRVIDWSAERRETSRSRAVLDRERLRQPLILRHWRAGDAMRPAGHLKRHTLAGLLNELGKSRWEKESWPVLTSAGKVAWALGLPVAEEFAIGKESRIGVVIAEESST